VLLILLFVGFIRVRLLDLPLERDEGEYAYAGQLILQGIPPYELAYNMKLPGTYYAYALGMAAFGQTAAGIHLTLMVVNGLTIIFAFLLGRKLFGVTAGLVACATYALTSVSPSVLGIAAHANHFVVLFAVPATWLLWKAEESNRRRTLFFSGLLYGLAFVMKQQGVCFCVFGCLFLIWRAGQSKTIFSKEFLRRSLCFASGMFLPFVLLCLIMAYDGVFSKFWFWTFTYASSYATTQPLHSGIVQLSSQLEALSASSLWIWLLTIVGLLSALGNKSIQNQIVFAILFAICSFLGTAIGLYFRPHYFILLLPAFAVLAGVAVSSLQRIIRFPAVENVFKTIPLLLYGMAIAWFVFYQGQILFQLPPNAVSKGVYLWEPFVEAPVMAEYIREHSSPNARIAVIGSEPEIYFYAHRHSATGYIYTYSLMEPQPNALKMQREMIRQIESSKPEYLVWVKFGSSWIIRPTSNLTILHWFENYSEKYYERVGIFDTLSGKTVYFWGDAARSHRVLAPQYIAIYKRKDETPN
jgi:Dolichyl-phosphate-mannose-protein mannosyltransferase